MKIVFVTAKTVLNHFSLVSQAACTNLWRASWQAGLAALAVWTICRVFPRLPSSTRCWLWRLTLLKFVLTLLLPIAVIPLPVLQLRASDAPNGFTSTTRSANRNEPSLSVASQQSSPGTHSVRSRAAQVTEGGDAEEIAAANRRSPAAVVEQERAMRGFGIYGTTGANAGANSAQNSPTAFSPVAQASDTLLAYLGGALPPLLFALYIAGVSVCLIRLMRCGFQTRRFLRIPRRIIDDSQIMHDALSLCSQLGIKRVPMLLEAPDVEASQLVAAFPPVVLLHGLSQTHGAPALSGREAYRLMLAHELAHLRRGDLWWSGFSALAHTLFFFHPLLWLARHQEELEREMACDALVLSTTAATPSHYGALLVELAAPRSCFRQANRGAAIAVASLGFADELALVRRRLIALKATATPLSSRRLRLLIGAATTATVVALLPWRLAAAHGTENNRRLPSALAVTAPPAAESVHGVVEGRVSLLPDNEAGANSVVHLDPIDGRSPLKIYQVPTDVAGRYRFDGVPAGAYRLWAQPDTRMVAGYTSGVPDRSSLHIGISQSQRTVHEDLLLTKNTVCIIGKVVDRRTGQYVDDVEVGAGTVAGGPESVVVWDPVRFPYIGYQLYATPGSVALYVRYGHYKPAMTFGTYPSNPYRLLPIDTPRVNRVVEAIPDHAVRADLGVDAHYLPNGFASRSLPPITGHVVGIDGHPAAGVEVYFFNFLKNDSQQRFPADATIARTDGQGRFRLDGVPLDWAGNRIGIRARDKQDPGGLSSHLMVTLPKKHNAALAPLNLVLRSDTGIDLTGQLVDEAGHPAAYVPVTLSCTTWKVTPVHFDEATITDAQGRYHFRQIWPNLGGWLLAEPDASHLGSLSEWSQHLKIVGRQGYLPPIVLKPTTHQIAGVVVTPEGKPKARQAVIVFSHDDENCSSGSAETDAEGRFRVDKLAMGSYKVYYDQGKTLDESKIVTAYAGDKHLRLIVTPTTQTKPRATPVTKASTVKP